MEKTYFLPFMNILELTIERAGLVNHVESVHIDMRPGKDPSFDVSVHLRGTKAETFVDALQVFIDAQLATLYEQKG